MNGSEDYNEMEGINEMFTTSPLGERGAICAV